ncbi:MAG TPA: hypothetical protein VIH90_06850 [Candidatus Saccharimonadales bacterium]
MSRYKRPSFKVLSLTWLVALLSTLMVAISSYAVWQDVISFRSCNVNSSDLGVSTCGKASINPGDGLLIFLFICSVLLVLALFTHAFRLTRRPTA